MAFKAKNKDRYHVWRSQNLHELQSAGIPADIAKDNRRFWFMVQEGEDLGYGTGWSADYLADREAAELYKMMSEFFEGESAAGWDLIDILRRRLGAMEGSATSNPKY